MKEYKTTTITERISLEQLLNETAKEGWVLDKTINNQLIWSRETNEEKKPKGKNHSFVMRGSESKT